MVMISTWVCEWRVTCCVGCKLEMTLGCLLIACVENGYLINCGVALDRNSLKLPAGRIPIDSMRRLSVYSWIFITETLHFSLLTVVNQNLLSLTFITEKIATLSTNNKQYK